VLATTAISRGKRPCLANNIGFPIILYKTAPKINNDILFKT